MPNPPLHGEHGSARSPHFDDCAPMAQRPHAHPKAHPLHASKLHILVPYSNPMRFESRRRLCRAFLDRMAQRYDCTVILIEAAFGDRDYEIAEPGNPNHLRLRCDHAIWIKEAMLQAGMRLLPPHAEYVAWVDSDIEFARADWVEETLHQLQHHEVVQLFSNAVDLDQRHEVMAIHKGFAHLWAKGQTPEKAGNGYVNMHPGYGWAWRLDTLNKLGGFITTGILGAGDRHMAMALVGYAKQSITPGVHANYANPILRWGERCEKFVQRNIGYVEGTIFHYFHGHKVDRRYHDRWQIIVKHNFDPQADLVWNHHGLPMLAGNKPGFRDDCMRYFKERNEDAR